MHSSSVYIVKFGDRDDFVLEAFSTYEMAVAGLAAMIRDRWDDVMRGDPPDDDEEAIEDFGGSSSSFESGDIVEALLWTAD